MFPVLADQRVVGYCCAPDRIWWRVVFPSDDIFILAKFRHVQGGGRRGSSAASLCAGVLLLDMGR